MTVRLVVVEKGTYWGSSFTASLVTMAGVMVPFLCKATLNSQYLTPECRARLCWRQAERNCHLEPGELFCVQMASICSRAVHTCSGKTQGHRNPVSWRPY